jgi:4-hydroxybenzoate polyprenyltransferase
VQTRARRLNSLLELVRLPNIFTAPADVVMGMAVTGAPLTLDNASLLLASALAYAGGMALNDAFDAPLDAIERPERPIPSGRLTRAAAFWVGAGCLAACLALAAWAGRRSFAVAVLLVAAIVLYDAAAKPTWAGPATMAACRALNAGLGASVGGLDLWSAQPVTILFLYILVVTIVSRFEVIAAPVALVRAAAAAFVALLVASGAIALAAWGPSAAAGLVFLVLLAAWLGTPLLAAMGEPTPRRIIGVIKAAVLGIIFLDAAFTGAARGLWPGLMVALLFVPAFVLGRRFASA